jgi:hypothetical protein
MVCLILSSSSARRRWRSAQSGRRASSITAYPRPGDRRNDQILPVAFRTVMARSCLCRCEQGGARHCGPAKADRNYTPGQTSLETEAKRSRGFKRMASCPAGSTIIRQRFAPKSALMAGRRVIILARATLGCDSPVGRILVCTRGDLCRMVVVEKTAGVSDRV